MPRTNKYRSYNGGQSLTKQTAASPAAPSHASAKESDTRTQTPKNARSRPAAAGAIAASVGAVDVEADAKADADAKAGTSKKKKKAKRIQPWLMEARSWYRVDDVQIGVEKPASLLIKRPSQLVLLLQSHHKATCIILPASTVQWNAHDNERVIAFLKKAGLSWDIAVEQLAIRLDEVVVILCPILAKVHAAWKPQHGPNLLEELYQLGLLDVRTNRSYDTELPPLLSHLWHSTVPERHLPQPSSAHARPMMISARKKRDEKGTRSPHAPVLGPTSLTAKADKPSPLGDGKTSAARLEDNKPAGSDSAPGTTSDIFVKMLDSFKPASAIPLPSIDMQAYYARIAATSSTALEGIAMFQALGIKLPGDAETAPTRGAKRQRNIEEWNGDARERKRAIAIWALSQRR